jgi:hypothetical protein
MPRRYLLLGVRHAPRDGWARDWVDIPRITRRTALPALEWNPHAPYIWPQPAGEAAANLMYNAILELQQRAADQEAAKSA